MTRWCTLQFDSANIRGKIWGTNYRPWIISDKSRLEMTFETGPYRIPGTLRAFKGFRATYTFHSEGWYMSVCARTAKVGTCVCGGWYVCVCAQQRLVHVCVCGRTAKLVPVCVCGRTAKVGTSVSVHPRGRLVHMHVCAQRRLVHVCVCTAKVGTCVFACAQQRLVHVCVCVCTVEVGTCESVHA